MEDQERFMREALKEAELSKEKGEVPIGAVIVCGGKIVGRGHNMTQDLQDPTAHAEMVAITSACAALNSRYLQNCTLYVTVEPCPMCAAAMAWAQVSGLVYGAKDPKRGYSMFSPCLLHPKTKVVAGVLEAECSAIVSDFFNKLR